MAICRQEIHHPSGRSVVTRVMLAVFVLLCDMDSDGVDVSVLTELLVLLVLVCMLEGELFVKCYV